MLTFEPSPGATISCCSATECPATSWVSQNLVQELADTYGIGDGGTSADGELTVQVVNGCLGVCDRAPVVKIDNDFYGQLTTESFNTLLQQVIAGRTGEGTRS